MNGRLLRAVLKEYGIEWAINRSLYSGKQKLMSSVPGTDRIFEKKAGYPARIDLFNLDVSAIRNFLRDLPNSKQKEITNIADNACQGKILGFSSIELDYGNPMNWQLNPLTGKSCDITKKWYQISDFDPERGDIKVIWEASRFSYFITLARAYLLTDDQKYYRAFSEQLSDWIEKNLYSYGANYKCGQECSFRMVNGLLAYTVFQKAGVATDIDKRNIESLILRCYRRVRSNYFYAYKCIKNNHTISELMGMIVGAWCCCEDEQLRYAFRTLDEVIDEQFTNDGGYRQFSFNYQRLALQDLEVVMGISDKVGMALNGRSMEKIRKAAGLMYQCQDEAGDMPNYGSNDGALVIPVTSCGYRDFRPVINAISVLISGNRLYEAGDYDEELLWFGNSQIHPVIRKPRVSKAFSKAGLYTLRKMDSWVMIVLNDYKSRPAHMDQLHIDLWVDGMNVLCDSGTFSYALEEGRKLVRNESHNTVDFDDKRQMNIHGTFMVYDWTKRGRIKHTDSMFYGESKSRNGYEHHRMVEVIEYGYRITDEIYGEKGTEYKVQYHTPCEIHEKNGCVELMHGGKTVCRLSSENPVDLSDSYRSLFYLKKESTRCIGYKGKICSEKGKIVTEIFTKASENIDG